MGLIKLAYPKLFFALTRLNRVPAKFDGGMINLLLTNNLVQSFLELIEDIVSVTEEEYENLNRALL